MTLRLRYIIIGLFLAGIGGFAVAKFTGPPDKTQEQADQLASETRDKNEAQQLAINLRTLLDRAHAENIALLQREKDTVTVQAAATIQQVYDTKSVWEIIRNYERNRATTRVSRPQEKITAIDEAGARVGITELKYITAVNIEHSEYKRNLAITEQQTEQFRQRVNSLKNGLDECGAFLQRSNEKLAVAEENAVPKLPFVRGLFLRGGIYSAFGKGVFDMQEKAYVAALGIGFQTRDFQLRFLFGGTTYPSIERNGYEEKTTSKSAFGYGAEFDWDFLGN